MITTAPWRHYENYDNRYDNYGLKNPVQTAIQKYEQHPSINLTKENTTKNRSFNFLPT